MISSYVDLHIEIDLLRTKFYDKRDDFICPIVNFLFICSNSPTAPVSGVYIPKFIFLSISLVVSCYYTRKLLDQGLLIVKSKSLQMFYGHHQDLVNNYGMSV